MPHLDSTDGDGQIIDAMQDLLFGEPSDSGKAKIPEESPDEEESVRKQEPIKPSAKTNDTDSEPTVEEVLNSFTITAEYAKKNPHLKPYIGKPLASIADAYGAALRMGHAESQSVKALRDEIQDLKAMIAGAKKEPETTNEDDGGFDYSKLPDPLSMSKEDFWKSVHEMSKPKNSDDIDKKIQKHLTPYRQIQQTQMQEQLVKTIEASLPEGLDFNTVRASWLQENAEELMDDSGRIKQSIIKFYAENPNMFKRELVSHANKMKVPADIEKKAKTDTDRIIASMRNKQKLPANSFNKRQFVSKSEDPDMDELYSGVIELINP